MQQVAVGGELGPFPISTRNRALRQQHDRTNRTHYFRLCAATINSETVSCLRLFCYWAATTEGGRKARSIRPPADGRTDGRRRKLPEKFVVSPLPRHGQKMWPTDRTGKGARRRTLWKGKCTYYSPNPNNLSTTPLLFYLVLIKTMSQRIIRKGH